LFVEVVAQITFLKAEKGGKKIPFGKGFSPKLVFNKSNIEYFTEFNMLDNKIIFPGEQIKLTLKIKCSQNIYIHSGASFDLLEMEKIIGDGTIMKII
tara:strand:- start:110 stop:400 length:291 start_codon:yes stop_codon:yes gene_type:complete